METCKIQDLNGMKDLVAIAQGSGFPVIVFDGDDECLVAMKPAVFERLLFDVDRLNAEQRSTLRL